MSKAYLKELRYQLAGEQNWRCCHCGCVLEPNTATIEHVIPRKHKGPTNWYNCAASCTSCNTARGAPFIERPLFSMKDVWPQ